jgi:hypothetical protein
MAAADRVTLLSGNLEPVAVAGPKLRFVRVGTLDNPPAALTPDVHIYVRSKLPWVALPEGIPSFDAYYDSRKLWSPASLERRRALLG